MHRAYPPKNRGRRECRMRAAPAVSCALCAIKKRTRAYRFSGGNPASPAQWLYGLYRALPGDRAFLPPASVMRSIIADLTPASGRQDHTALPYATALLVSQRNRVHRNPVPRFVTIAKRPSSWAGMRRFKPLICPTRRAKFCPSCQFVAGGDFW